MSLHCAVVAGFPSSNPKMVHAFAGDPAITAPSAAPMAPILITRRHDRLAFFRLDILSPRDVDGGTPPLSTSHQALVIGELVNRASRSLRPLGWRALDIRRRLPDHKGSRMRGLRRAIQPLAWGYYAPEPCVAAPSPFQHAELLSARFCWRLRDPKLRELSQIKRRLPIEIGFPPIPNLHWCRLHQRQLSRACAPRWRAAPGAMRLCR